MKYGIREICDVVLKAKAKMTVGSKVFYKDEPVIYFDSLKTSTMEGAATTVYAQGGRGNSRLIAWEGERTVTFTMEDALISTVGLAILTGADVIDAKDKPVIQHVTETVEVAENEPSITIDELELSVRAYNCLKRASINSMAELLKKSEHDLLNIKNFGKKSSDEVIERLRHFGLDLAPNPEMDEDGMVIESAE